MLGTSVLAKAKSTTALNFAYPKVSLQDVGDTILAVQYQSFYTFLLNYFIFFRLKFLIEKRNLNSKYMAPYDQLIN